MELGSTLQWIAPADECTSSLKLFDSVEDQWRSAVREFNIGRRDDRLGISFPYSKSHISDDVRLLERRTAAAIVPRHLY